MTAHRFDLAPATPEEVGVDPSAVERFVAAVERRRLPLHSLLVIHCGRVLVERYTEPWTGTTPSRMYSVSKSFTAVALGTLVGEGRVGLDDPIIDLLPEYRHDALHPWTAAVTVRDLLTMSTVHATSSYKDADDTDLARTFFTVEPTRPPGRLFSYDTSASVVLATLVERLTGRSVTEHLTRTLWSPLRAEAPLSSLKTPTGLPVDHGVPGSPPWREVPDNPDGVDHGGSGFLCAPRDLARFAQFVVDLGRVDGTQLVPADYLAEATSPQVDISLRAGHEPGVLDGYGFQIWHTLYGGFAFRGMGGQHVLMHRDEDLIVLTTADDQGVDTTDSQVFGLVWDHLLPAVGTSTAVEAARTGVSGDRIPEGSRTSPRATDQSFTFDDNPFQITSLGLEFGHDHGVLVLHDVDGTDRAIPFGLAQWRSFELPVHGMAARACGVWCRDNQLRISVRIEDRSLAWIEIGICFGDDGTVTVGMVKAAEAFLDEYQGVATSTAS